MAKDNVKITDDGKDQQQAALDSGDHNPFKENVPVQEETPEEAAKAEQKRKEALTERD